MVKKKNRIIEVSETLVFLHDVSTFRDVNRSGKVPSNPPVTMDVLPICLQRRR